MMMLANACSYVYQIIMGRLLPFNDYGALNALFSLITIASVPGTAITLIVSKYISEYNATGQEYKISFFLRRSLFYISIFTAILIVIGIVLSPAIKWYLNVEQISFVILVVLIIGSVFMIPIPAGTFQGAKEFWKLGIINVVSPIARLVIGIILVFMGYKLNGALGALLAGNILAMLYGFALITKKFKLSDTKDVVLDRKDALKYGMPVMVVTLCITILTNLDMIMVKHYFPAHESGIYGAAVIFGRAIYYFPTALVMAMFPLVTEANVLNKDVYISLKKALLYNLIICGAGVAALNLFPQLIIKIFFGQRYLAALPYIKLISIAMYPLCLLSIVANFNLAVNKTAVTTWSMIVGCIAEYVLITFFHSSVTQVLYILMAIGIVLLVVSLVEILIRRGGKALNPVGEKSQNI